MNYSIYSKSYENSDNIVKENARELLFVWLVDTAIFKELCFMKVFPKSNSLKY